ncbi:MAG TPA: response regulator [bacterium]|nr:response regulator [bacterium]
MATVLVVDDRPEWRQRVREALASHGHTVVGEAADGLEAVALYPHLTPHVVTMDIQMPNMDGVRCLEALRALDPAARVVMVTSIDSSASRRRCYELGAVGYVVKPFTDDELVLMLEEALLS